jgi:hypothetical protein
MRSSVKKAAALATTPMLLGSAASVALADPVGAYSGDYSGNGVSIRELPLVSSDRVGLGYIGQGINTHCFKHGDWVTRGSFSTNVWDYHTNRATGVIGFSSAAYLDYPLAPPIPPC